MCIFIYNFFSLFVDICKVAGDCDEILFSPDGSWAPLGVPGKDTKPVIAQNGVAKQSTSQNSHTVKQQTSITKIGKAKICVSNRKTNFWLKCLFYDVLKYFSELNVRFFPVLVYFMRS